MPVGLALSGGGFRATLFHLGVVRALRDAGVLKDVTHVCSVSGGSILAAHLVLHWEDYLGDGFDARSREILDFCSYDVRNRILRRYPNLFVRWVASKIVPFGLVDVRGPTDLLQDGYRRLYGEATLEQLRGTPDQPRPALHILTTNVTTGTLCSFGADGFVSEAAVGTGRTARDWARIPAATPSLCFAVAASSAFPGMFSPLRLTAEELGKYDAPLQPPEQFITDGGVYDNLGVRKFLNDPAALDRLDHVFVSNASLELRVGAGRDYVGMVKTAMRASDLLGHRVHQLESASMERASEGKFVPINIRDVIPRSEEPAALHENTQEWLRWIRTDLDRFSPFEQHCLIRHGWSLGRRAVRSAGLATPPAAPWDPGPAVELPDTPARQVKQLSKSVVRRARLFDARDRLSWVHAAMLILLAGLAIPGRLAYERWRRPLEIRAIEEGVRSKVAAQQHRLAVQLSHRRSADGKGFAFHRPSDPSGVPGIRVGEKSSAFLSLATLSSLLADDAQREGGAAAANLRVLGALLEPGVFDGQTMSWPGPEDGRVRRIEPTAWCISAISRLLPSDGIPADRKALLRNYLHDFWVAIDRFRGNGDGWRLGLDAGDGAENPYASVLVLNALLDFRPLHRAEEYPLFRDRLLPETAAALAAAWKPSGGWELPRPDGSLALCDGLTMQAYAALLRAEEAGAAALTPPMLADLAARVERLRERDGENFIEQRILPVAGSTTPAREKMIHQWLPSSLEAVHAWAFRLRRRDAEGREVQRVFEVLERLVGEPLRKAVERNAEEITENLAELHLPLGRMVRTGP
jgi:predicted acylesterase/phospholipase RssA